MRVVARHGRTVIIVVCEDEALLTRSREIIERNGAESLDAAREKWWIGLRNTEETRYDAAEGDPEEQLYRSGFEAALEAGLRGKTFHDAQSALQQRFPRIYQKESFQRGYERGQKYYSSLQKDPAAPPL